MNTPSTDKPNRFKMFLSYVWSDVRDSLPARSVRYFKDYVVISAYLALVVVIVWGLMYLFEMAFGHVAGRDMTDGDMFVTVLVLAVLSGLIHLTVYLIRTWKSTGNSD